VVVGNRLAEGRSPADVRFILGRALELARPEYVLAAALGREQLTRLLAAILRAFHPRHNRRPVAGEADEAATWKRALPYKVAKRLADLIREHAETPFSTARWRRGVRHSANRAGLLMAGDVIAAARVLGQEGERYALDDLARFAAGESYAALRAKLEGGR
jgi:hypothetical protein